MSCCFRFHDIDLITFNDYDECFICWDKMCETTGAKCFVCKIVMHNHCSKRFWNGQGYTKCPHCSQVGKIGGVCKKSEFNK